MSSTTSIPTFPSITSASRPTIPMSLGSRLIPSPTTETTSTSSSSPSDSTLAFSPNCNLQSAGSPLSIASLALAFGGLLLCLAFLWATFKAWKKRAALPSSTFQSTKTSPGYSQSSGEFNGRVVSHPNQPGAANPSYHHPSKLHHLVLIAWGLFTLDQTALLLYLGSLYFVCPQYSCSDKTLAQTPGCLAPKFLLVALYLQVVGSAAFVCASINRFMRLYSVLSRTRYILLRLAYVLVAVVLAVRLVSLTAHEYVRLDQAKWPIASRVERQMHHLNILTYTISYLVFGVLDLVALVQGLIFIGRVRRDIRTMVMTLPRRPSSGSLRRSSTTPTSKTGRHTGNGSIRRIWSSLLWSSESSPGSMEQQARMVMVWIAIGICLLIFFAGVMSVLPSMLKEVPVLLYNALMTLLLKLFAAFVSLAITGAGQVIAEV